MPPARVGYPSAATSSSPKPSPRKAATALGVMARPAPTSPSSGDRSRTVTCHPVRASEMAEARPATPAPTTTAACAMRPPLYQYLRCSTDVAKLAVMPRRNPARRAALADAAIGLLAAEGRSEERRVGKEWR